jgi:hypothetical protein
LKDRIGPRLEFSNNINTVAVPPGTRSGTQESCPALFEFSPNRRSKLAIAMRTETRLVTILPLTGVFSAVIVG